MPTLCIVLANSLCNTHRSGIDIVPSRQERNLIVPCTAAFLRQRKGVAAGAATRTECHVNGHGTTTRRHFPFLRILPFCVLRRRFAFRRVLLYLSSKTIYENDWERHPQRVLISLLFPIWHTAIVSVIHYHGVHTLSMLLSSTSLVSLCRCPTPYRVSANLQAGLSCTTKIVTLHGKVYRMANWPSTIQVI